MHMKDKPIVSVAMGVCYRDSDVSLLERSVCSILTQNVENFELLICEHGSSEEAKEKLREFAKSDSRIHLLDGRSPGTLSQNLNDCLKVARGKYIARMDDDDYSHPNRFSVQLAYLNEHPDIAFVGCDVSLVRDKNVVGERRFPKFPIVHDFYMTQPYIHPSLMFRHSALKFVGGYSEDSCCLLCEDYDLLLRLYAKGFRGANLQEVLLDYTIPTSMKGKRKVKHRWNEVLTRYRRFRELDVLPKAFPYVVKPLVVGLLPERVLAKIKKNGGGTNAIIKSRDKTTTEGQR